MNLKEWTIIYLKQKDMIKREIASIKEDATGLIVTTKEGKEKKVLINETLTEGNASIISCLNTKENVQYLISNWEIYATQPDLLLIFANPEKNEKWLLKPHQHSKIADKESLKQGLLAMHEAITAS